jgi:hypothetical protein
LLLIDRDKAFMLPSVRARFLEGRLKLGDSRISLTDFLFQARILLLVGSQSSRDLVILSLQILPAALDQRIFLLQPLGLRLGGIQSLLKSFEILDLLLVHRSGLR